MKKTIVLIGIFVLSVTLGFAKSCLDGFSDSVNLAQLTLNYDMEVLCDSTILIANSNCINEANKKYNKALDDALTTLCVCDPAWC